MDLAQFEQLVEAGLGAIPVKFRKLMDNVEIVIADYPSFEQITKMELKKHQSLFGLYEGIPQTKRGHNYSGVLPDKITIFQKVIEYYARDDETVKEMVKDTIWHEIAHHFGMNEAEVRASESRKKAKL